MTDNFPSTSPSNYSLKSLVLPMVRADKVLQWVVPRVGACRTLFLNLRCVCLCTYYKCAVCCVCIFVCVRVCARVCVCAEYAGRFATGLSFVVILLCNCVL